jgi:hypothetical protein
MSTNTDIAVTPRNGTRTVLSGELLKARPDLSVYPSSWPYRPSLHRDTDWLNRQSAAIRRVGRYEPALDVTVHGPSARTETVGLLDTGARCTSIPIAWAEALGFDLSRATTMQALGNGVLRDCYMPVEPVRIEVAGRTIEVAYPMFSEWHHVILGRADVFSHFRVTFDERAQQITLDPYPEDPSCP